MAIYEITVNCETGVCAPIADIKPHPSYTRSFSESDILAMGTSLVNIGYSFPISLINTKTGIYCFDGHLRLETLKRAMTSGLDGSVFEVPKLIPVVIMNLPLNSLRAMLELSHSCEASPTLCPKLFPARW